jgi:hypothetical protein
VDVRAKLMTVIWGLGPAGGEGNVGGLFLMMRRDDAPGSSYEAGRARVRLRQQWRSRWQGY